MITGPLIAEIAALVGEPARATMLSALLDGRALTAAELAFAARITPQTASTHLGKLTEAGLISAIRDGRHRYFRLASAKVAGMLDGIMAVALENRPRYKPLSRQARELSDARVCYDHLAGRLSVDLADFFMTANTSSSTMKLPRSLLMGFDFLRISGLTYLREQSVAISAARASIGLSEDRTSVALSVPLLQSGYSTCTGQKE